MAPHFHFRCLGLPELRGPGGESVRFRVRKHLALLAFLAVERHSTHRRERLVDLLWPEARPSEGRHSLATALSVIRSRLGPDAFESTRDTVRLVASDLEVDLERLARGEVLGDELTPSLEVAGFLEGFEVSSAPEFMFWRDIMRARWLPQIRDALVLLMDRSRRAGDFTRIEDHADRLLSLDELSEDGIRAKMEARAFAGDRVSALRLYRVWRARLAEELDATPSPLLEGMALRLRQRGYSPPGAAQIPPVATEQWQNRAFVGRGPQYRELYERWEATREGSGRHGLVLGDSGIGKTTLVERLLTAVGLEGAVTARVQCYELEREIPYAAIGALVRAVLDRPGANGTGPEWMAELARMIPAVAQRFRNLPAPRETTGESARLRFTEAVHELLTAMAEEHPVVLVLDDVHLADNASVAVLHLLMRRTQAQRIMLLLAAREPELELAPHGRRLLQALEPLALHPVRLGPLSEEEITAVVESLSAAAGATVPPAVRTALLNVAAGVPMMLELLFDDWRQHGEQCLALAVAAMTVHAPGRAGADGIYQRLFERMLEGLSPTGKAVLNLAAILGDRLNDLTMYEIVDLSLAQTLAGMTELIAARVLRDGGARVEFRYELLRNYSYLCVPSTLRRALHGRIADRLLAAEADGERVPGLMLAWHCFRAGRVEEAVPYLFRGARQVLASGAAVEAELALQSALPSLDSGRRQGAQLLLANAMQEQGRWEESLLQLPDLDPAMEDDWRLRRALLLAGQTHLSHEKSLAVELFSDILSALKESPRQAPAPILLSAAYVAAERICDQSLLEEGIELASRYIGGDTPLEARIEAARLRAILAWRARALGNFPEINESINRLTAECRAMGLDSASMAGLQNVRGILRLICGDYREGLTAFRESLRTYTTLGQSSLMSAAQQNIAICHGRLGEYQSALEWSTRSLSGGSVEGNWRYQYGLMWQAWAHAMLGAWRSATEIADRLGSYAVEYSPDWIRQRHGLFLADIRLLVGASQEADRFAAGVLSDTGTAPLRSGETGRLTRWLFRTTETGREADCMAQVAETAKNLEGFDLLDRAEILGTLIGCKKRLGLPWSTDQEQLSDILGQLPQPVTVQLRRLEALG